MEQQNFNNTEDLTEKDISQIVNIVGNYCRINTKKRIRHHLKYCKNGIPKFGIMNRLIKENDAWSYCAGQSYPDEIKTVRKIILELR